MSTCIKCNQSRQAGDKSTTDIVGCRLMTLGKMKVTEPTGGDIYEGYIYGGRIPGDTEESNTIGKGTITLGILIDANASCENFENRS